MRLSVGRLGRYFAGNYNQNNDAANIDNDPNKSTRHVDTHKNPSIVLGGINRQTLHAAAILVLAIGTSVWWNKRTDNVPYSHSLSVLGSAPHQLLPLLLKSICKTTKTIANRSQQCHAALAVSRRRRSQHPLILAAVHGTVPRLATVLTIPRNDTLWDIDALRDPWIQQEFFFANSTMDSINNNNNGSSRPLLPSTSAAYLAAFLARLMFVDHDDSIRQWKQDAPTVHLYLAVLPRTLNDFSFHPLLWATFDLKGQLGTYTSTYDHILAVRQAVSQEYNAFSLASVSFAAQISLEQYQIARLNVLTRSFGSGPLVPGMTEEVTRHEFEFYKTRVAMDLSKGCHVMVPLLDQFNHHAQPHVMFSYQSASRAFVVQALRSIASGSEIYDSYGARTDADLLAKYGFVNGDGSDYTQASLALWHHINPQRPFSARSENSTRQMDSLVIDEDNNDETNGSISTSWKMHILRYFQYDDGYEFCVARPVEQNSNVNLEAAGVNDDEERSAAWTLKRLKYQHLVWTGNVPQRWVVRMPPRDTTRLPNQDKTQNKPEPLHPPPAFDRFNLHFDASHVFSTCRLIVLTHMDYNRQASAMLQANLRNASYRLPSSHEDRKSLEFRTLMCVARLSQTALGRFGVTVEKQLEIVSKLDDLYRKSQKAVHHHKFDVKQIGKNWTIAHVRLGEMQTLEVLKQTAYSSLRLSFADEMHSPDPAFSMRDNPCPINLLQPLFDEIRAGMP